MEPGLIRAGKAALSAALLLGSLLLRAQQPAGYAGSEACQTCHEDTHKAFQKNAHAAVERDKKRGWEGRSCESCHGPGAKHAESVAAADISNPAKLAPARADEGCLKCHRNQATQAGRILGGHARHQVSCVTCHPVHKAGAHAEVSPRAARINRQCADCHNPHGSFPRGSLRTVSANEPGCLRCHGDKRGPFVFEHAPARLEGCATCHESHGSANPRMLTRQEVSFQCLECHANIAKPAGGTQTGALGGIPPAIHDMRSPRFRNCTTCHLKIHGSQVNRAFLR